MPPWHPNLRNASRLPDTKVVRTSFFVNGIAAFVTILILLWFAYQEYQLHNLNRQIAFWQAQIDRDTKDSNQFIEEYHRFKAEQDKIVEVNAFLKSRPTVSELLMYLAQTLPKEIALDSYDQSATGVTLHATLRGSADEASGYATAYLEQLRADKTLAKYFSEVSYSGSGVERNIQTGRLSLQLFLKFGTNPKGAKK